MFLNEEIEKIEKRIKLEDSMSTSVSQKGVYWHVDHLLKVIISVGRLLKKSAPKDYKWKFNISRLYVFTTGYFPRGVGKAPKITTTEEAITRNDLLEQLDLAKDVLWSIDDLSAKSHFLHQYFGVLDLKGSKKMLKIHTRHHLKIIRDIDKGNKQ